MSMPIPICSFYRAAKDEKSYRALVETLKYNILFGSYTQFPCACEPKCEQPSQDEIDRLNERLKNEDWPWPGPNSDR